MNVRRFLVAMRMRIRDWLLGKEISALRQVMSSQNQMVYDFREVERNHKVVMIVLGHLEEQVSKTLALLEPKIPRLHERLATVSDWDAIQRENLKEFEE